MQNNLVIQYLPLVYKIAQNIHKRNKRHIELNDLINYGVLGLIKAIDKFDSLKNVTYKTYFYIRIYGYILDQLRELDQYPILYTENYDDYDYLFYENNIEKVFDSLNSIEIIKLITTKLSDIEKKVIILYFYENLNQRQIGEIVKLTYPRVSQIYVKALKKLRACLQK